MWSSHRSIIMMLSLTIVVLSACSGMQTVAPPRTSVAPGTQVPFAQVMNPGFADEYIGADVVTEAEFFDTGTSGWSIKIPRDYFVFQAVALGSRGTTNPLTRQAMGEFVVAPRSMSSVVFGLKPGDRIRLRGGTEVIRESGMVRMMGGTATIVKFVATSVERVP